MFSHLIKREHRKKEEYEKYDNEGKAQKHLKNHQHVYLQGNKFIALDLFYFFTPIFKKYSAATYEDWTRT